MEKKLLIVFLIVGLIAFIAGITMTLTLKVNRPYGVFFMTLGAMWTVISFGKLLKSKKSQQ